MKFFYNILYYKCKNINDMRNKKILICKCSNNNVKLNWSKTWVNKDKYYREILENDNNVEIILNLIKEGKEFVILNAQNVAFLKNIAKFHNDLVDEFKNNNELNEFDDFYYEVEFKVF